MAGWGGSSSFLGYPARSIPILTGCREKVKILLDPTLQLVLVSGRGGPLAILGIGLSGVSLFRLAGTEVSGPPRGELPERVESVTPGSRNREKLSKEWTGCLSKIFWYF